VPFTFKGFIMFRSMSMLALVATLGLAACDRQPIVVNAPPAVVTVPGPAGPQGATGNAGNTGAAGKAAEGTTVIVMSPAASAPSN
jgi:hypothetical protein